MASRTPDTAIPGGRMSDAIKCPKCELEYYDRICDNCGNPFTTHWKRQRFCHAPSRCKDEFHRNKYRELNWHKRLVFNERIYVTKYNREKIADMKARAAQGDA